MNFVTQSDAHHTYPFCPMKHPGFAQRFRSRLLKLGHSTKQADVARLLSCSTTTAWNYLHGEKLPAMESAIEIACKLKCCVEWLLTGRGNEDVPPIHSDSEEERRLLILINTMTQKRRGALLEFLMMNHNSET